jgi:hypothetical protein
VAINLKKVNKIVLYITSPLYFLLTIALTLLAPFSLLSFDAPDASFLVQPLLFVIGMILLPCLLYLAFVLSLVLYRNEQYKQSLLSLLLPFIPLVMILLSIIIVSGF